MTESFPGCGTTPLGLYPIVDNVAWLKRLLPLGVKTIQLRIKNSSNIIQEIQQGILLGRQYNARLFINDYWELAIRYGAYGVHLGQEDLKHADIEKIRKAGLRLGVSTHCLEEVACACEVQPSYVACGPIFHTTTKVMPFEPQGVEQLQHWRHILNYPLVAIGGINQNNIMDVLETNVEGVALITAITKAADPELMTQQLLATVDEYQANFLVK